MRISPFENRIHHEVTVGPPYWPCRGVVTQIVHNLFHHKVDFCLKHPRYLHEHGHSEGMSASWMLRQISFSHKGCASLGCALSQNTCLTGSLAHHASAFCLKCPAEMLVMKAMVHSEMFTGKITFLRSKSLEILGVPQLKRATVGLQSSSSDKSSCALQCFVFTDNSSKTIFFPIEIAGTVMLQRFYKWSYLDLVDDVRLYPDAQHPPGGFSSNIWEHYWASVFVSVTCII